MKPHFWILACLFINCYVHAQTSEDKLAKTAKSASLKHKSLKSDSPHPHPEDDAAVAAAAKDDTEPISALGITVPPEFANDTVIQDHHTYYNSTFFADPVDAAAYWTDIEALSSPSNTHGMLSNSHRQATTVELSFEFPFYGHSLRNITIATGGFLYMGDYLHNWIAATQYVAPLMANFDTSQSSDSFIKYADNGTAFVAQWENVFIQDRKQDGAFTFQVTLHKSGDIVFAYKNVPFPVSSIPDDRHPVKVGISDAYILERSLFFVKRKTIYEYHRVDLLKRPISNNTAIYIKALPTCPGYRDCSSCVAADPKLECGWCEAVKRCSDGIDRARQLWVASGCAANKENTCSSLTTTSEGSTGISSNAHPHPLEMDATSAKYGPTYNVLPSVPPPLSHPELSHYVQEEALSEGGGISAGAIITIVAFILAVIGASVWVGYAYKFPQSSSGQFLIKYRPSQWSMTGKESDAPVGANARHF